MSGTQTDIGIKPDHNRVDGEFAAPSRETYNVNHGRVASAPTVGGVADSHTKRSPRGKAPDAPTSKRVSVEFLG